MPFNLRVPTDLEGAGERDSALLAYLVLVEADRGKVCVNAERLAKGDRPLVTDGAVVEPEVLQHHVDLVVIARSRDLVSSPSRVCPFS